MLADFLYSHPTWLIGLLMVSLWTGLSLFGLYYWHRFFDVNERHRDTETVGLTYAFVAVVYGVFMALIVVDVFDRFTRSDSIATAEANRLSTLMFDSAGLPSPTGAAVRSDLDRYIDLVVKSEWPSQRRGKLDIAVFEPGWTVLGHLSTELATFEPATKGQNSNKAEMLHAVNDLIKARRGRILAAGGHLPVVVWKMLVLGGVISIVYSYFFGARQFGIQMAITGLIASTIALVFVLIVALDFPFRGDVSVSPDAFILVRTTSAEAQHRIP